MTDLAMTPDRLPVVAMVTSTGGLAALSEVLAALPADFGAAVVVLQHLEARRESLLAKILSGRTPLPVCAAVHGARLTRGNVYVAPAGRHLSIRHGHLLALDDRDPVNFSRPSADVLLSSLASADLPMVAVVLTGWGADGANGALHVRNGGGTVLATDEESSTNFGMPGAADAAGGVSELLPLPRIAPRLVELISLLNQADE